MIIIIFLILLLTITTYTEITDRKVYNWLTVPAILVGLLFNFTSLGLPGLGSSGLGFTIGFGLFLIIFLFGGMGGGDVKFMGAVGALMGYPFIISVIFYTALVGGLMAIVLLIWRSKLREGLSRSFQMLFALGRRSGKKGAEEETQVGEVPYALAMVIGTIIALFEGSGLERIL